MPCRPTSRQRAVDAWRERRRLTRIRFWELLVVEVLATIIGSLVTDACYAGALATMPLDFTIIAADYEGHVVPQFTPDEPATDTGSERIEPSLDG